MTGNNVLPETDLLEKAATRQTFEYSLLDKELKAQIDIEKKQYQKLDNPYEFNEIIKKEKPTLESDLIYNSNYSFLQVLLLY